MLVTIYILVDVTGGYTSQPEVLLCEKEASRAYIDFWQAQLGRMFKGFDECERYVRKNHLTRLDRRDFYVHNFYVGETI